MLAQRSRHWSLVRSLTHPSNDHSAGHQIMLSGRSDLPPGFNPSQPRPNDWPSIAAIAGDQTRARNNLPPAVILPEKLIHFSGRVINGAFAGLMGPQRDPWIIEASPYESLAYGAYPDYEFDHQQRPLPKKKRVFQAPSLSLPEGLTAHHFDSRLDLLKLVDHQRRDLERIANLEHFDRFRQGVIAMLTDPKVRHAFDVTRADPKTQDRYGRNAFGWS